MFNLKLYPLPRWKSLVTRHHRIHHNHHHHHHYNHCRSHSISTNSSTLLFSCCWCSSSICLTIIILIIISLFGAKCQQVEYENFKVLENSRPDSALQQCSGEWKYPSNCSTFQCDYKATWEYQDDSDEIVFTISTRNRNKWTGIAFSDDQSMPNTDAILGLVEESGRFFLMDSYLQAYEAPPLDQHQNLYNMSAWREHGVTTLRFSRPRQTGDSRDYQFSDVQCPYFIFPVMGGVFNAVNKRIRKHESLPVISENRICVRSCRVPTTTTTTIPSIISTTTLPSTSKKTDLINTDPNLAGFGVSNSKDSTILNRNKGDNNNNNKNEKSKTYQVELKFYFNNKASTSDSLKTLEDDLYRELKPRYNRIRNVEIQEFNNENSIATIDLFVATDEKNSKKNEKEEIRSLSMALNGVIQDNQIGDAEVDSNHMVISEKMKSKTNAWFDFAMETFNKFNEDEQKWIIIGAGIVLLVFLALVQLTCMFCGCCCCSSSKTPPDEYMDEKDNIDKQWKEYNDPYQTGYAGGVAYDDYALHSSSKSNSLHKGYRNNHHHHSHQESDLYHQQKQSLDRKHYEMQQQQQHGTSRKNQRDQMISPSSIDHHYNHGHHHNHNDRHNNHHNHHHHPNNNRMQQSYHNGHQMQPDFYFMPHQRKYSSDVARVYVDYEENQA